MQILRSLLKTNPQIIRNVVQPRNMSGIPVPARQKVSKGEMIFLASLMGVSWLFIPGWVLVNMKNYRSHE